MPDLGEAGKKEMGEVIAVTVTYSPRLIRAASMAYLRRGFGLGGMLALAVFVAAGLWLVVVDPGGLMAGAVYGAGAVMALLLGGLYLVHYRQGMAKLKRMGRPHALIEFSDEGVKATTETGTFSTGWSSFSGLWRSGEVWLLVLGHGQFMTLPAADLSPEAKSLLSARFP